jgi:hypothetical protein
LVQFGFSPSKLVQTKIIPDEFFLGFLLTMFFRAFIFLLAFIFQKINSNFFIYIDPYPEVKPKKNTQNKKKGKKRSNLTAKKQREDQKLLKCKTIKSLLFEPKKINCKKST